MDWESVIIMYFIDGRDWIGSKARVIAYTLVLKAEKSNRGGKSEKEI